MPLILPVLDKKPVWGDACFIADNATIVGDVRLGDRCSVWFNAVVRGDVNTIHIGHDVNIQDGAIIHCTYKTAETNIHDHVSIGHRAIVHGCTVHERVLVGMGAIVMDHAVLEPYTIIAAGSVILENTVCETGFIYAGTPARKIKAITADQRRLLDELPARYVMYADWFQEPF